MALPNNIQRFIDGQAERVDTRYDDLRALVFNGTLKRSPEISNTDGLVAIVRGIFERVGVCAQVLYDLKHIGLTIPPQGDTYWTGEAGPGPSYLAVGGGEHNAWATRNTVFLAWNVLHLARILTDAGGIPTYGNSTHDWDLDDPEHPNPKPPKP